MRPRSARFVVLVALTTGALSGCAAGLQIGSQLLSVPTDNDPELDGTGWLTTHTGASFADVLQVSGEPYVPGLDPIPVFGVGWSWRVATFDFGAVIEHIPGLRGAMLDGRPVRLGEQVLVAGTVRWRFVDRRWGGFFVRVSPGLGVFGTTETLRGAIAERQGRVPDAVDDTGVGFMYSADVGFFAMLSDELILQLVAGAMGTHGSLMVEGEAQDYERYRGLVRLGLEWRL
jgi:hypothetical protein